MVFLKMKFPLLFIPDRDAPSGNDNASPNPGRIPVLIVGAAARLNGGRRSACKLQNLLPVLRDCQNWQKHYDQRATDQYIFQPISIISGR